ncbi:MAG: TMEM175 family protein [Holophagaceae bacterium]
MTPHLIAKHRLEALVDGVFAIAMTILVLEVKVPDLLDHRSATELLDRLRHAWPILAAYLVSFCLLGLFWFWHHRLMAKILRVDVPVFALSLLFLALVSFFPFAAALMGRYPINPVALMVYLPTMGLILTTQAANFALALRRGCVDPAIPEVEILAAQRRNLRGCGIFFLAATPSAIRIGPISLVLCLLAAAACFLLMRRLRMPKAAPAA